MQVRPTAPTSPALPATAPRPTARLTQANRPLDAFEPAPANRTAPVSARNATEHALDGALVGANGQAFPPGTCPEAIPPVMPNNGKAPTGETVVYVNGVSSELKDSMSECQQIANATGEGVINLHNAADGVLADLVQSVGDYFGKGKNLAVDSLTELVYQHLKDGQPLHLVAHSQGTMITSRALTNAKILLERDGMSEAQAEEAMKSLKVETFASAAASFPDGPRYVHYLDDADPVARLGLDHPGTHPGEGAVVKRYDTGFDWRHPLGAHNIGNYLSHWQPFPEAA